MTVTARARFALLAITAIVAVLAVHATQRIRRHYIPRELLACGRLTGAAADECFAARFHQVARAGNLHDELDALREMRAEGWLRDCHVRAHQLGMIAYAEQGPSAYHVKDAARLCTGGYAHAVAMAYVPEAISAGQTLEAAVGRLCGALGRGTRPYVICTHGAGHGAFVAAGESLTSTASLCNTLPPDERRECAGGAVMQNSMRFLGLDSAEYAVTAPNACVGVPNELRSNCHDQIGEIAVFQANYDGVRARATCERVPDMKGREECMRRLESMLRLPPRVANHWHHRLRVPVNPEPPALPDEVRHTH